MDKYAAAAVIVAYATLLYIVITGIVTLPGVYTPDPTAPKLFCGNGDTVPRGYDALGSRFQCLRKGYGAGKYTRERVGYKGMLVGTGIVAIAFVLIVFLILMSQQNTEDDSAVIAV